MRANLVRMIDLSTRPARKFCCWHAHSAQLRPDYTEQFRLCYTEVHGTKAASGGLLLNGIALPNLMQADGIHPENSGSPIDGQYLAIAEAAFAP